MTILWAGQISQNKKHPVVQICISLPTIKVVARGGKGRDPLPLPNFAIEIVVLSVIDEGRLFSRHLCRCLYGCHGQQSDRSFKIDLPPVRTLFDECEWMPFISNETPYNDTWDGEDRASAIKKGTVKQVLLLSRVSIL
jgi:hypothetical protein